MTAFLAPRTFVRRSSPQSYRGSGHSPFARPLCPAVPDSSRKRVSRKRQVEQEELVIRPVVEWGDVGIIAHENVVREPRRDAALQRVHRAIEQHVAVATGAGLNAELSQGAGQVVLKDEINSFDPAMIDSAVWIARSASSRRWQSRNVRARQS